MHELSMYRGGDHLPQNTNEAILWFTKASEAGYSDAHFMLGRMYYDGQLVPKDLDKAICHFKMTFADKYSVHLQDARFMCSMPYVGK